MSIASELVKRYAALEPNDVETERIICDYATEKRISLAGANIQLAHIAAVDAIANAKRSEGLDVARIKVLLEEAADRQLKYWHAVQELENALGEDVDLGDGRDLNDTTAAQLVAEFGDDDMESEYGDDYEADEPAQS